MLSGFEVVKIGTKYTSAHDGADVPSFPSDARRLAEVEVHYEELPGWHDDISGVREYGDLPAKARAYVERIEELTGLPCTYIGVGPGRDAIIVKK